ILEKLAINIFEAGKRRTSSFGHKKTVPPSDFYLGRSPKPYDPREEEGVFLSPEERNCHSYILGSSGSGKTTFLEKCIRHDIMQKKGFCFLDAHGDATQRILAFMASLWQKKQGKQKEEMVRSLILVEPFNNERITGYNPLETASGIATYPCAIEMLDVFKRRWPDFGPRMEELFRVCLVTLADNGLTLLELPLLLTDRKVRESLAANLTNPDIKAYWLDRYDKLSQGQEVQYREPVLNKVTAFIADDNVRHMIGQAKSTFDFRKAMDTGKWIVINLCMGRLQNSVLLGGLLLAKIRLASLSRADILLDQRRDFFLYLDEFENFINAREGVDLEVLLAQSKKYRLHLTMAHQTLSQIDNSLLNAVLGNIGALFCFRLSYADAVSLSPVLNPSDKKTLCNNLIKLKTGEAYSRVKGKPCRLIKVPFPRLDYVAPQVVEDFKDSSLSFSTRSLAEVKKEIEERHRKLKAQGNTANGGYRFHKENFWEGQNGW
ncbi:MAG: type IV secretion system DNA-binding domain-containing protein, partial [Candidatus Pacebacteria bacterium]|nr:type IV secretion system DNA-binding domain-containing protein [Candidatus Paceibacterota bacterium]